MDGKHPPKNPTDRNKSLTQIYVFELAVFCLLFLNFIYNIIQATQSIHCGHKVSVKIKQDQLYLTEAMPVYHCV